MLTKVREATLGVMDVSRPDGNRGGRTRWRKAFTVLAIIASAFDGGGNLVQRYSSTASTSQRTRYNVDTETNSICNGLIERRSSITDDLVIAEFE